MLKIIKEKIFEEITLFGGFGFYAFLIAITYFFGYIEYCIYLTICILAIYFFSLTIRLIYFKDRPKKIKYKNLLEKLNASSFPSIHAARVTVIFFIILLSFSIEIKIISGILWVLVIYSRIYLKKHYTSDVIGGMILGLIISISYISLYKIIL